MAFVLEAKLNKDSRGNRETSRRVQGACEECLFLLAEYLSQEEACSVIVALPPRPLTALTLTCNAQSGSKKARDRSQEKPRTRCRRRQHQVEVSVRWFDGLVIGSFGKMGLWGKIGRVFAGCRMGKVLVMHGGWSCSRSNLRL